MAGRPRGCTDKEHCSCPARLTQVAWARHRGISDRSVRRLVADGRLEVGPDRLLDRPDSDARYEGRTRHKRDGAAHAMDASATSPASAGTAATPARSETWAEAQERHERARADLAELKVRELGGEVVRVADVTREWYRVLRSVRDRVLAVPDRLAGELAAVARDAPDPMAARDLVRARLGAEIHAALTEAAAAVAEPDAPADGPAPLPTP
mgnify:CR=1 FL=1